jgi:Phosphotransferase enzyme family
MSENHWRSSVHGLLMRPTGRVLLTQSEHGWALPSVELDGFSDEDLSVAQRAFEELLGAPVAILRYVDRNLDRDRKELEVVDVLECSDPHWTPPPPLEWVDAKAVAELRLEHEPHRELVARVVEEHERGTVPSRRAPWAREGWLAGATAWIVESLAALGRPATARTEQVRVWSLSCVLRTPTAAGDVYFKATAGSPLFVDEGAVMRGVARLFPENVPLPLAVDHRRRWMLLDDVGPELGWDAPAGERQAALGLFGRMQVTSSEHLDQLLAAGCIDRRPEWLERELGALLADDESLAGLDEDEVARLRSLEPRLRALCRQLADGPVPNALVHGDLHLGNVGRRDGRHLFFDWTDACVAHPFLDLIDVVREENVRAREALLSAYLAAWGEYSTTERLVELWQLAEPLLSLNQAISYRFIRANVEPSTGQELEGALPHWLRNVLAADLDALPV